MHRGNQMAGFTIVEVLLVVFIVGLSTTIVVMNLPEGPARLEAAVSDVERSIGDLEDRAVTTGVLHGLQLHSDRFEVATRVEGEWSIDRRLGYDLDPDLLFVIDRRRPSEDLVPDIIFDPSGIPSSGTITIADGAERTQIRFGADAEDRPRR